METVADRIEQLMEKKGRPAKEGQEIPGFNM